MTSAANDNANPRGGAEGRRCPICGKPASDAVRPFCSKRCADIDLHRWLGGTYRVPATEDEADAPPDADEE